MAFQTANGTDTSYLRFVGLEHYVETETQDGGQFVADWSAGTVKSFSLQENAYLTWSNAEGTEYARALLVLESRALRPHRERRNRGLTRANVVPTTVSDTYDNCWQAVPLTEPTDIVSGSKMEGQLVLGPPHLFSSQSRSEG